jgi:pimeloyl-ACP methyl ester carboxylesterase
MNADPDLWPVDDFEALTDAFHKHGFRPPNAWYLNDDANIAYAHEGRDNGRLSLPVLFLNGDLDALCDVTRSPLGGPMQAACETLTITTLSSGHWLPLERKSESVQAIQSWLEERSFAPKASETGHVAE